LKLFQDTEAYQMIKNNPLPNCKIKHQTSKLINKEGEKTFYFKFQTHLSTPNEVWGSFRVEIFKT